MFSSPIAARRRCLSEVSILTRYALGCRKHVTILGEDSQALLDQQSSVEDDQAKAQGQDIIACPHFEEVSDSLLQLVALCQPVKWSLVGCASKESHMCIKEDKKKIVMVTYQADPLVPFDSALGLNMRHWLGLTSWSLSQQVRFSYDGLVTWIDGETSHFLPQTSRRKVRSLKRFFES